MENTNQKTIDNLSNEAVDGTKVQGGDIKYSADLGAGSSVGSHPGPGGGISLDPIQAIEMSNATTLNLNNVPGQVVDLGPDRSDSSTNPSW